MHWKIALKATLDALKKESVWHTLNGIVFGRENGWENECFGSAEAATHRLALFFRRDYIHDCVSTLGDIEHTHTTRIYLCPSIFVPTKTRDI